MTVLHHWKTNKMTHTASKCIPLLPGLVDILWQNTQPILCNDKKHKRKRLWILSQVAWAQCQSWLNKSVWNSPTVPPTRGLLSTNPVSPSCSVLAQLLCSCELNRPRKLTWLGRANVSGAKLVFNLDQFPDLAHCVIVQILVLILFRGSTEVGGRVKLIFFIVLLTSASLRWLWNGDKLSKLFFNQGKIL